MQPPPPTGWTGKAPPGAGGDGGAGVMLLEEAAVVVVAVVPPGDQPAAETSTATQAHIAAAVLPLRFVTTHHCSFPTRVLRAPRPDSEKIPRSRRASSQGARSVKPTGPRYPVVATRWARYPEEIVAAVHRFTRPGSDG